MQCRYIFYTSGVTKPSLRQISLPWQPALVIVKFDIIMIIW